MRVRHAIRADETAMTKAAEIHDLFDELETLLKDPEAGAELASRGVNVSLAMTLADGLNAYLKGDKAKALLELVTATDEIAVRMTGVGGEMPS